MGSEPDLEALRVEQKEITEIRILSDGTYITRNKSTTTNDSSVAILSNVDEELICSSSSIPG